MGKTWKAWTKKEVDRLAEMRGKGMGYEEIGAILGRTASAIRGACHEFDIPWINPVLDRWVLQFMKDPSVHKAALVFGCSVSNAKRWKARLTRDGYEFQPQKPGKKKKVEFNRHRNFSRC